MLNSWRQASDAPTHQDATDESTTQLLWSELTHELDESETRDDKGMVALKQMIVSENV